MAQATIVRDSARAILDRLADLSAGYGTKFIITEDTAVLELPPGAP